MVASAPSGGVLVTQDTTREDASVSVASLTFKYPALPGQGGSGFEINGFELHLPPGSRCLLSGANGTGKTTLLQVLAGKYMVPEKDVLVLGRPAFHDVSLTNSGELSYLGTTWRREVGSAGSVALGADIPARTMIFGVPDVDPARRQKLIEMLDIDLDWSMMKLSDGQRRRVQICLGLLREYKVLLLDEVTVDLDVVGRLDLLEFFKEECETRGATVVYATHIFDGLEGWCTHLAYLENGRLKRGGRIENFAPSLDPKLYENQSRDGLVTAVEKGSARLLEVVEEWLREERVDRTKREAEEKANGGPKKAVKDPFGSRHMAYFR